MKAPDSSNASFENVWLMFQETDKKFQDTDKKFQDTDKKFQDTDKKMQDTDRQIKELKKMIFGIGENQGHATEDFFYNGFDATRNVSGIKYDYVERNRKRHTGNKQGEYDILLINGNTLLVVEVKFKLHPEDVIKFATVKLKLFRELFPEYANYTVYAGVAGMSIPDASLAAAREYGLMVFTQSGQEIKCLSENNASLTKFWILLRYNFTSINEMPSRNNIGVKLESWSFGQ